MAQWGSRELEILQETRQQPGVWSVEHKAQRKQADDIEDISGELERPLNARIEGCRDPSCSKVDGRPEIVGGADKLAFFKCKEVSGGWMRGDKLGQMGTI